MAGHGHLKDHLPYKTKVPFLMSRLRLQSKIFYVWQSFLLGFWKLEFKNPLLWKVGVQTEKLEFAPKTLEFRTASC